MKRLLRKEIQFYREIGKTLSMELSERQEDLLEVRYSDYGGFINFVNESCLHRLIKAIKKGYMSIEQMTVQDAEDILPLLTSERLNEQYQAELSHLLYGADERARYLIS